MGPAHVNTMKVRRYETGIRVDRLPRQALNLGLEWLSDVYHLSLGILGNLAHCRHFYFYSAFFAHSAVQQYLNHRQEGVQNGEING